MLTILARKRENNLLILSQLSLSSVVAMSYNAFHAVRKKNMTARPQTFRAAFSLCAVDSRLM